MISYQTAVFLLFVVCYIVLEATRVDKPSQDEINRNVLIVLYILAAVVTAILT